MKESEHSVVKILISHEFGKEDYNQLVLDARAIERLRGYPEWPAYQRRLEREMALTIRKAENTTGDEGRALTQGMIIQARRIIKLPQSVIDKASRSIDSRETDQMPINGGQRAETAIPV